MKKEKSCDTCKWLKDYIECTNPNGVCPICTKNYPKWQKKEVQDDTE